MAWDNAMYRGWVATDPDLRYTPKGTPILRFAMAINGRDREDEPIWLNVLAFNEYAEYITNSKAVSKGMPIEIWGRLQTDNWQTRDGENKKNLTILASRIYVAVLPPKNTEQQVGHQGDDLDLPPEEDLPF